MAEVVLHNLTKRFGRAGSTPVVRDLNLHVPDGELLVLVGPSGCGKTTTLRLVAGLEQLSAGEIRIGGRNVNAVQPRDRNVAMVFQDYALYPHMTVERNMAFGLKMQRLARSEIESRLSQTAAMLGLDDLLHRKPRELSGGQRQRAALGRALARRPEVLLLDEPLSNLDPPTRMQLRTQIKALHQKIRGTMIHVTHDQEEAMTLGDRVAVMAAGTIQQAGTPMELYRTPANRFVAAFFGSPAMNFMEGRIEREGQRCTFVRNGMRVPLPSTVGQFPADREVILGVRPEHLHLMVDERADAAITASVSLVESLGDPMNVHAKSADGIELIARTKATDRVAPGQTIRFEVAPEAIHLFEPGEFGASVT